MKLFFFFGLFLCIVSTTTAQVNSFVVSHTINPMHQLLMLPEPVRKELVGSVELVLTLRTKDHDSTLYVNLSGFRKDSIIVFPKVFWNSIVLNSRYNIRFVVFDKQRNNITKDYLAKYLDTANISYIMVRPNNMASFGHEMCTLTNSFDKPTYCQITSIPENINADVYYTTLEDWENVLKFKSPPINEDITAEMVRRIKDRPLGNFAAKIQLQKIDRNFVIIIDHQNIYTAKVINPWLQDKIPINIR